MKPQGQMTPYRITVTFTNSVEVFTVTGFYLSEDCLFLSLPDGTRETRMAQDVINIDLYAHGQLGDLVVAPGKWGDEVQFHEKVRH